jgi:hypothetical protein
MYPKKEGCIMEIAIKEACAKLKASIKQCVVETKNLSRQRNELPQTPETGPQRHELWCNKKGRSGNIRRKHLAVCFLRGRLYREVERKTHEKPYPSYLPWVIMQELKSLFDDDTLKEMRLSENMLGAWCGEGWRFNGQTLGPDTLKQESLAAE